MAKLPFGGGFSTGYDGCVFQGPKTYGLKIKLRYFLTLFKGLGLARYVQLWDTDATHNWN